MRSTAAALLASAAVASAAITVDDASVALPLVGAKTTIVVPVKDPAAALSLPKGSVFVVTLSDADWVAANKASARSIRCKISDKTVQYGSTVSGIYGSAKSDAKYFADDDNVQFGVELGSAYTGAAADEPLNLICSGVTLPAAAKAVTAGQTVTVGPISDLVITDTSLPQIFAADAVPDSNVVTATVTVNKVGPMSKAIYNGLRKEVPLFAVDAAVLPSLRPFTAAHFKDVVNTRTAAEAEDYTVKMTVVFEVSPDTTAAEAVAHVTDENLKALFAKVGVEAADVTVDTAAATAANPGHCRNLIKDAADGEADVDVGGACVAADKGQACLVDTGCWTGTCEKAEGAAAEDLGECVNSASALTVSFGVVAAFVATALFGF